MIGVSYRGREAIEIELDSETARAVDAESERYDL